MIFKTIFVLFIFAITALSWCPDHWKHCDDDAKFCNKFKGWRSQKCMQWGNYCRDNWSVMQSYYQYVSPQCPDWHDSRRQQCLKQRKDCFQLQKQGQQCKGICYRQQQFRLSNFQNQNRVRFQYTHCINDCDRAFCFCPSYCPGKKCNRWVADNCPDSTGNMKKCNYWPPAKK